MAYSVERDNYQISDEKQRLNIPFIHQYLSVESYWAKNIPLETVERSVTNSLCLGVYYQQKQIGFARLVTDKATFAYLADVFIIDEHRGHGLAKWLVSIIPDHPELKGLRRFMLGTKDAHGLYRQFGWTALPEPDRFMQLHFPDVYKQP